MVTVTYVFTTLTTVPEIDGLDELAEELYDGAVPMTLVETE